HVAAAPEPAGRSRVRAGTPGDEDRGVPLAEAALEDRDVPGDRGRLHAGLCRCVEHVHTTANDAILLATRLAQSRSRIVAFARPARRRALPVAGTGPSSMTTGSSPTTTAVTMRASGRTPCAAAQSEVVTASAAAPSEICEDEPAVTTPSGRNGVFSPPRAASV